MASRLCNSSLFVKNAGAQMSAQGVINANYPQGPGRTESAGGSRVKSMQGQQFSTAVLAAIKQLQRSEQVSINWPVGRELKTSLGGDVVRLFL